MIDTKKLFDKPKIISIVGDVNQGKSMLIYNLLDELLKKSRFNLYYYGLRCQVEGTEIRSIKELERISNSLIICDEFFTLFDLDNRKAKRNIENTLRLINHKNNILVLVGVGENFKKFISNKTDVFIYKQVTLGDMINGSRAKELINDYHGEEKGSEMLNLNKDEALVYDGEHYNKFNITYLEKYDSKKKNPEIFQSKEESRAKVIQTSKKVEEEIVMEKDQKNVSENVQIVYQEM